VNSDMIDKYREEQNYIKMSDKNSKTNPSLVFEKAAGSRKAAFVVPIDYDTSNLKNFNTDLGTTIIDNKAK